MFHHNYACMSLDPILKSHESSIFCWVDPRILLIFVLRVSWVKLFREYFSQNHLVNICPDIHTIFALYLYQQCRSSSRNTWWAPDTPCLPSVLPSPDTSDGKSLRARTWSVYNHVNVGQLEQINTYFPASFTSTTILSLYLGWISLMKSSAMSFCSSVW